jgi:hypothetical protein
MADVPAHVVTRQLTETVWYPEHLPRKASAEYHQVHRHLVYELDEPCWVCGIRQSQLPRGQHNETHHWHLEWALANAIDPFLLVKDVDPQRILTADSADAWLREFLDSEGNMLVLCSAHHRHGMLGIHCITYPAWVAQKWLRSGHDISQSGAG